MRVTSGPAFTSLSFVQFRSCALKPAPVRKQGVSTVKPTSNVPRMPCAVPVPVVGPAKLLSTVSLCPILVVGRSQQGQESAWRGHIALYPHTNSVRPTHLPDPPCSLTPILVPGVLGFQGCCLIGQTSTSSPFTKWGLFSQEFSKVHSAKLGRERALGGKRVTISPQLMLQKLASAPGIHSR